MQYNKHSILEAFDFNEVDDEVSIGPSLDTIIGKYVEINFPLIFKAVKSKTYNYIILSDNIACLALIGEDNTISNKSVSYKNIIAKYDLVNEFTYINEFGSESGDVPLTELQFIDKMFSKTIHKSSLLYPVKTISKKSNYKGLNFYEGTSIFNNKSLNFLCFIFYIDQLYSNSESTKNSATTKVIDLYEFIDNNIIWRHNNSYKFLLDKNAINWIYEDNVIKAKNIKNFSTLLLNPDTKYVNTIPKVGNAEYNIAYTMGLVIKYGFNLWNSIALDESTFVNITLSKLNKVVVTLLLNIYDAHLLGTLIKANANKDILVTLSNCKLVDSNTAFSKPNNQIIFELNVLIGHNIINVFILCDINIELASKLNKRYKKLLN